MSVLHVSSDGARLRKFGLTVAIGFGILGSLSLLRHHTIAPVVWLSLAGVNALLALVAPTLLRPFERVWQALGDVLGWINTRIILTVLFYVVVTPAGLLMRLFRDPLDRDIYETRPSYWNRRNSPPFDPGDYQRQF